MRDLSRMPHVTFIHGIGNKPEATALSGIWRGVLADHDFDLGARGVSSSMVYWADLLYPEPLSGAEADMESAEDPELAGAPEIGMGWMVAAEGEEAEFISRLAADIGYTEVASDEGELPAEPRPDGTGFERVPLPWVIKRPLMKILLRDVHHYLFDVEVAGRDGVRRQLQQEIRARTVAALEHGADQDGPHVIVAHSLGSVIAYDCLKRVADCPTVDGLLTIGSPLGLDEVQDRLRPEWGRSDGFPSKRVRGRWVNVYDRLDPVAGLDPELGNDYRRGGQSAVEDIHEPNHGRWRHSIDKYLAGRRLRGALHAMIEARQ